MKATSEEQTLVDTLRSHEMTTLGNEEMVLIKGYSGCGEPALASKLYDWVSDAENGLFVQ